MHVVLIIAGVADPKKPLVRPATGQWTDLPDQATTPFKLSPFDEAALETALKLRDRDPATRLSVIVTDGGHDVGLLRAVASHRIDHVLPLPPAAGRKGNLRVLAARVSTWLQAADEPADLLLIGREHGDLDDGVAPSYLANALQLPFLGLALKVHADDATWRVERIMAAGAETWQLPRPALVSISNDKSNKLRHPLMKNVMAAKQQRFEADSTTQDLVFAGPDLVSAAEPAVTDSAGVTCEWLTGDLQSQAQALARYLKRGNAVT